MKTILSFVCLFIILRLVSKDWKTIKRVLSGWGIIGVIDFLYDFPFWIWMQHHFGIVVGSVYASIGAMMINMLLIAWYQASDEDWLGVNLLEQLKKEEREESDRLRDYEGESFLRIVLSIPAKIFKLVVWSLNKTELTTFFVFSIFTDSFKTTIFMRHGRTGELDWRDAKVFVVSTVISCTAWSVLNATIGGVAYTILFWWQTMFG